MKEKIFITRRLPEVAKFLLGQCFEVDENNKNESLPPKQLLRIIVDCDGILSTVSDKFTQDVLKKTKKLKVISNYAAGLDNIDAEYAKSKGISIFNVADVVANSTADLTFALLLSLVRKIPSAIDFVKSDRWRLWDPEIFWGEELCGKTLGIIGCGRIGQAVARRAIGFGLNVIFYNRSIIEIVDPLIKFHTRQVKIDDLLKKSDYISIHVPLTKETKNMINLDLMKKMIKKPIILNLARGAVVDTDDLTEALKQGLIRGAALDVTSPEPISGDHPLCRFENCIIVPHIGTSTKECRYKMAEIAAQNIINYFKKQTDE